LLPAEGRERALPRGHERRRLARLHPAARRSRAVEARAALIYPQSVPAKLYIRTFGCQMNEYDSGRMADVLREAHGMETTPDPEAADVILFNTCSVREKAQEKVFTDLGRVRHLKR